MANTDSSVTPEKKLLKLIEDPQSAEKQKSEMGFDFKALLSPSFWAVKLAAAREKGAATFQGEKVSFSLKKAIRIGRWITLVLGLMLFVNLLYEHYLTNQPVGMENEAAQRRMAESSVTLRPLFTSTMPPAEERNVFIPFGQRGEKEEPKDEISLKLVEMTQRLRLTGISIYPGNPKRTFCMIEDLQKNMTSFLREGDTISGLKVSGITADGVILRYQDQEIELK